VRVCKSIFNIELECTLLLCVPFFLSTPLVVVVHAPYAAAPLRLRSRARSQRASRCDISGHWCNIRARHFSVTAAYKNCIYIQYTELLEMASLSIDNIGYLQ